MSQANWNSDLLICHVCFDDYDLNDKIPKMLSCHHTFCLCCVKKLASPIESIVCPTCQKKTEFCNLGIQSLQTNFYLAPLISRNGVAEENGNFDELRREKIWCRTCKHSAEADCISYHDIYNYNQAVTEIREETIDTAEKALKEIKHATRLTKEYRNVLKTGQSALDNYMRRHLKRQLQNLNANDQKMTCFKDQLSNILKESTELLEEEDALLGDLKVANQLYEDTQKVSDEIGSKINFWKNICECDVRIDCTTVERKDGGGDTSLSAFRKSLSTDMRNIDISGSIRKPAESALCFIIGRILEKESVPDDSIDDKIDQYLFSSSDSSQNEPDVPEALSVLPMISVAMSYPRCFLDVSIRESYIGRVIIMLRSDMAPKMTTNFIGLCTGEFGISYKNSEFFKAIPEQYVLGGDITNNDGTGSISVFNGFPDFKADQSRMKDDVGYLKMRCIGQGQRGEPRVGSQFQIWTGQTHFRHYPSTLVFGQVVEGLDVLRKIESPVFESYHNPLSAVISNCGVL